MANNKGKKWEGIFEEDFINSFPNGTVDRIYDTVNGYLGIKNICDYIGYDYPLIFYIECKSHKGASFPLVNLTQYDELVKKVGIKGVRAGVVLWLEDKDTVHYIPISTVTKLKEAGIKSINPEKLIGLGYNIIPIPGVKKRVYIRCNYKLLKDLKEGE